jgi:O-succinylbenzoate synthase
MAKAALEMAALDAELRRGNRSLAAHLGATATSVAAGVTIGIERDLGLLWETATAAVEAGYQHLKLKVRHGWDVEPIAVVRTVSGVATLGVDANGAYRADDIESLRALDAQQLAFIEQPTGIDALDAHAELASLLATPVALDEDVTSFGAIRLIAHLGSADCVVIKSGRFGSLDRAHLAATLARRLGLRCWLGGMYETGIGRAANLALAACECFDLPVDWSASDRYWDRDLTAPHVVREGRITVPSGPGLGVIPDLEAIASRTRERRVLTPSSSASSSSSSSPSSPSSPSSSSSPPAR